MITVYRYGFEMPKPVEPPPTPWGTYAVLALAAWWAWAKWSRPARQQNPRRPICRTTRRRNPRPTPGFKMGDRVRVGKKTGVIVGQPSAVWRAYAVKLSDGRVRDYAIRSVRPA